MNSTSIKCTSAAWLRWCWQAYLEMETTTTPETIVVLEEEDVSIPNLDVADETTTTMEMDAFSLWLWRKDSNFLLWNASKWNHSPIQRLIHPITGVVNNNNNNNNNNDDDSSKTSSLLVFDDQSPKFLITVNKADHLCDEGIELAKALEKAGASVTLFQHNGLHFIGSTIDTVGNKQRLEAWLEAIY
jgi:acetyl esterase/lipase